MIANKRVLAVITARGGSKGLPGKNIKPLLGKPLIFWTLEAAHKSRYIDTTFVSTDSQDISEVVRTFGEEVPELRPAALASDTASSIDVVLYTIERAEAINNTSYDWVCLLEPTSPLRDESDVDTAMEQLAMNLDAQAIVGVCKSEAAHPRFLVKIENGFLEPYLKNQAKYIRRQDLDPLYYFEGSVYISEISALQKKRTFYHDRTIGYVVPRWKSLEVDELCDLIAAEALLKAKKEGVLS